MPLAREGQDRVDHDRLEVREHALGVGRAERGPGQRQMARDDRSAGDAGDALRPRQQPEFVHAGQRPGVKQHCPEAATRHRDPDAGLELAAVPLEGGGLLRGCDRRLRLNLIRHVILPGLRPWRRPYQPIVR